MFNRLRTVVRMYVDRKEENTLNTEICPPPAPLTGLIEKRFQELDTLNGLIQKINSQEAKGDLKAKLQYT